jgi:cytochrome c biogenesis protein
VFPHEGVVEAEYVRNEDPGPTDPFVVAVRAAWRLFSSIQFALILILLLIVSGLIGVIVPQAPGQVASDQTSLVMWQEAVVRPEYGDFVEPLAFFGLFTIFHSPWMTGLGILLVGSVLACTARRWRSIRATTAVRHPVHAESFYEGDAVRLTSDASPSRVAGAAQALLRKRGFRAVQAAAGDVFAVSADRHRFSALASLVSHLGLVVLLAGVVIGARYGFHDEGLVVAEGGTRDIGHDTGLSVELVDFVDEYWEDGTPRDFRADIILYEQGQRVVQGTLRVNHPLSYGGVRLYQGYFGSAPDLRIADSTGRVLFDQAVPLSGYTGQQISRPSGLVRLAGADVMVSVVGHVEGLTDDVIAPGQLGVELYEATTGNPLGWALLDKGVDARAGDFVVTYAGDMQFAALQARRDPGLPLVWTGCAMLIVGICVALYLPRRTAYIRISAMGRRTRIDVRTVAGRKAVVRPESRVLATLLAESLKGENDRAGG